MKTLKFNSRLEKGRRKGLGNSKILTTDSILLIILKKRKTKKLLKCGHSGRLLMVTTKMHTQNSRRKEGQR